MKDIKLLRNRVLIKQDVEADTIEGGIIISVGSKPISNIGRIVSVSDVVCEETVLNVGDKVMFERNSGINVLYKDVEYLMINEKNIQAILED
jgi:co-chaperonin GroES (HSP10)